MQIREARPSDLDHVLAVECAAFGSDVEACLVRDLLADPSAAPTLSLLAWDEGRAVGHVLFTVARIENATVPVSAMILAPLAVVPEAQSRGIGGTLIREGLALLKQRGVDLVFVLGHPGYYTRHGFEPAIPQGLIAPYPIEPETAWMVQALRPGLLGSVRGRVVCADVMNRPEYWRE
ncbi:GNAT family N-acetyltransferase [Thioalkalivibrio sulfidiphilus]|uniref:GNAT family N-acetyltransferase n=1 Tax=Thioalkalivibrio sulfidiphilus TaxID=1033854 RepID=UPI003BAFC854